MADSGSSMRPAYVKRFDDRYAQSREFQFLDLLEQLQAPVPHVLANDLTAGTITMSFEGDALDTALGPLGTSTQDAALAHAALAQAIDAAVRIGDLGVFHLDIAPRNFVVGPAATEGGRRVRLIDFALAVSRRFPALKPLWMRPVSGLHHPALVDALSEDWWAFFDRNDLPRPPDLAQTFDIPSQIYRDDWYDGLAVDRIDVPWCVMAHGLGRLLLESRRWPCLARTHCLDDDATKLLALTDDTIARQRLQALREVLTAQVHDQTPRPTRSPSPPPLTDTRIDTGHVRPQPDTETAGEIPAANSSRGTAAVEASASADRTRAPIGDVSAVTAGHTGWARPSIAALLVVMLCVFDEAVYAHAAVGITGYTLMVIASAIGAIGIALMALASGRRPRGVRARLGAVQATLAAAIALELWARGLPVAVWAPNLVLGALVMLLTR